MKAALSELKVVLDIVGTPVNNPLYGIGCTEYSMEVENALEELPQVIRLLDSTCAKLELLNKKYSDSELQSLEAEWLEILSKNMISRYFAK
jgi:hypothetical protein